VDEHLGYLKQALAVTGGIASGKSRVTCCLAELGAHSVSLDDVSRALSEPDGLITRAVAVNLGREFLNPQGRLDRARLANYVFSSASNRKHLNSITHPLILAECNQQLAKAAAMQPKPLVVEVPLLFECGMHYLFRDTLLVWCSPEVQIERLLQRGLTIDEAQLRIDSQLPVRVKRHLADFEIENSADWNLTERTLLTIWKQGTSR